MNINTLKINQLYQTADYHVFEMHPENRDLQKTKDLEASMKKHGYIPAYPLHCKRAKGRLVIKAGHHRFYVASKLNIPLWFCVTEDDAGLIDLEIPANPWTIKSYLESETRAGNPDYATLGEFQKETGLTLRNCASLLGGESASSGNQIRKIKRLAFKVKDTEYAYRVANLIAWLKANGVIHAKNSRFVGAISKVMQVPDFNEIQFKERVLANRIELVNCATEKQFIDNIAYVYNKSSRKKIPLAFLVNELMKDKSPVGK